MTEVSLDDGIGAAFDSAVSGRLTLLAGAGLSMAPPSSLPSAAQLAIDAKRRYTQLYGQKNPPFPDNIDDQAQYYFERGELATFFLNRLVDRHAFAGEPNEGHFAIADLLLVNAIRTAVTTNLDALIENAGSQLRGQLSVGVDEDLLAMEDERAGPLLKIHGCRVIDPANMVWARGQITVPPVSDRIAWSSTWLQGRLTNKDLLIVGYATDWDYLNEVLERALGSVNPSRVIVVDLADEAAFQHKAPELHRIASLSGQHLHIRASGDAFLAGLREQFSRSFIRGVLQSGASVVEESRAVPADLKDLPAGVDNKTLWQIRRDLEGCLPSSPCQMGSPPLAEQLVGMTLIEMRLAGAVLDGAYWRLNERLVRVIRSPNAALHRVRESYRREMAPVAAPDVVIAVGADACQLAGNIARPSANGSIARGADPRWLTRGEAMEEFDL
ncbi:SIR2 family protein [Cognatilysobacter lacus]|uniref:Uncharacterized protein n=1 Tax=Cognatilysobacter lacus TaxID=1643323 RepID=A0A5D8Z7J7_9GAMM|nr:SIR2 family protein [Lysobacter lacus]TZF90771.1 hypothetical protein FW784_03975 [Lysobacter lacus]